MELRTVISIRGTRYVSIPKDICKALEIKPGEKLKVSYVTGTGIFLTQVRGADRAPMEPGSVEGLKKAIDVMLSEAAKKLKSLESNLVSNYCTSMIQQVTRLGIFELQRKVDLLIEKDAKRCSEKGALTLVRERKKGHQ